MDLESLTTNELIGMARTHAGLTYSTRNRQALIRKITRALDAQAQAPAAPVPPPPPPEPETAEQMIRRLWGRHSVRDVAARLTEEQIPTATGGTTWWPSSVQMVARRLGLPVCAPRRTEPAST